MFVLNRIIFCILLCYVNAEWNTKDFLKREHSLLKPYQGAGMTIPYWDFLGSTIVTKDHIRLTPDEQSMQGGLWNSVPCYTRNWELQVQFKVHGRGKELFGDGFAIWYTKDRMKLGPVFGNTDFFQGVAIIVDTYSNHNGEHNHKHPYISGMVNNGTLHYDHDKDGTHTQLAGCEAKFRNFDHDTYIAVRYESNTLSVYTDLDDKAAYAPCFEVGGVNLPTGYYFGVSAATGDLSDNHDILAVRLYQLDDPELPADVDRSKIIPSASSFEPPRERIEDVKPSMGNVKLFFLLLLAAIGIIICVICGIILYQKHQENKRKRFY